MGKKQLTLTEKWKIDAEAYKKGAVNKTSAPQCIKCRYIKKGDALRFLCFFGQDKVCQRDTHFFMKLPGQPCAAEVQFFCNFFCGDRFGHVMADIICHGRCRSSHFRM